MSGDSKPDIRKATREEIARFLSDHREKSFRAGQVYEWLWKKGCTSFDSMTNIPASCRSLLRDHFSFPTARLAKEQASSDGTRKILLGLDDDARVEGVLIPAAGRTTACISSQAGCPLGCKFCATGALGFTRNLLAGEIFDQVTVLNRLSLEHHNVPLSNIVYMGMGEPLLNYEQVMRSVEHLTSPDGMGLSPQRITVSSVGVPAMIMRMADDGMKFHFALSLHAATDEKRSQIIPFNLRHPLADLTRSLQYYHKKTSRRFTIEYILFRDFNDSLKDARDLAAFCKSFPVKVNLIEYNPVEGTGLGKPEPARTKAFAGFLEGLNMVVNIRKSRGSDIDAACGQLAMKGA